MARIDQKLRSEEPLDWKKITAVDKKNRNRLKEIIKEVGFISPDKFGKEVSHAAWLIVQHSDKDDVAFMEKYLDMIKSSKADFNKADLARLIDRIEVYNDRPQIYGNLLVLKKGDDVWRFRPIKDIKLVDSLRAEMGLNSLKGYAEEVEDDGDKVELPSEYKH